MNIRRTKIWRDLLGNKSRTVLVVLSIAVGVAAFGLMILGRSVLEKNLADAFAASNPAHVVLYTSPLEDAVIDSVAQLPRVAAVEARHFAQGKLEIAPDYWISLELHSIPDFNNLSISRITPQTGGTYPPSKGTITLERSIAEMRPITIGQTVRLQTLDGSIHELTVAGFVNDLSRQPSNISLIGYGFVSPETLELMGEPTQPNQLYIVLRDPPGRDIIERGVTRIVDTVEQSGVTVYSASVPEPGKQVMGDSMTSVLLILAALGTLTLALSAFLIINIMSAVMAQQIPQIGILKSMGGQSRQVMFTYFEMVLWFGLLGLALAIPMSLFGAYFLVDGLSSAMNFDISTFQIPPEIILLQIFGAVGVPLLAAAVPILTGSRITIREAITGSQPGSGLNIGWLRTLGRFSQVMLLSVGNTFRRTGRLTLTLAALSLAGAMFIALIGIRQSLRQAVSEIQANLNYDVGLTLDRPYPVEQLQAAAESVPEVTQIETWGTADARRIFDDDPDRLSGSISLIAVPPATQMTQPTITQGRWLQPDDDYVLFVNVDMLEMAPDLAIGKEIRLRIGNDERLWRIVGVSAREFRPAAYIPYHAFEEVTGLKVQASQVVVLTADHLPQAQSAAQDKLLAKFSEAQIGVISSSITTELKQASADSLDILVVLLMVMVVLIAVVGGLGLAIAMGLNVLERTSEIGILRALGATNGVIRRVVVVEGLLIGIISWAIGTVLSVPLAIWLGNALGLSLLARPLDYLFSVPAMLIWLVLVAVIAVLSSLLPAQQAARLTIRDTLAYVG